MDPMDYILHNHPRSAAHYDPVHAPSGPWMPHPQPSPAYPWQTHGQGIPQSYSHHPLQPGVPIPGSDPFQLAPNGGLPPPVPGYHGGPPQDGFAGAMPPRHFHHSPHRMSAPPGTLPGPGNHLGPNGHVNDGAFVNQVPGGRPLSFQPPVGLGMPTAGNSEPNSLPRPPFSLSDLPANGFPHHNHPLFVPPPPPPGPFNPHQSRRSHFPSSSTSSRSFREVPPARPSQQSSTSRRSHPRARRSMSSRFMASDSGRDEDDELGRQFFLDHIIQNSAGLDASSMDQQSVDNVLVRQIQLVRGAVSSKMVASKMTLRSLQSVNINDLPEAERTCVICYNDYGVETPEGINEAPLRLPKCKHIFGDHCIKKWFEDSDSCPYCRDKLHAEPKQHGTSARAFMNMVRMRGGNIPPGLVSGADDVFIRALTMSPSDADSGRSSSRQTSSGGRRSPPDDEAEQQRRTRPRHSNPEARGSSTATRPISMEGSSSSGPDGNLTASLFGHRNAATHAPPPTHRRAWSGQVVGAPAGDSTETSRRPGLAQTTNSMSPSAPSFFPRGGLRSMMETHDVLPTLPTQQQSSSSSSSRLPNPLQSPDGVARGGQSDIANASAPRSSVSNMQGGSGETNQAEADQNNRNRPW